MLNKKLVSELSDTSRSILDTILTAKNVKDAIHDLNYDHVQIWDIAPIAEACQSETPSKFSGEVFTYEWPFTMTTTVWHDGDVKNLHEENRMEDPYVLKAVCGVKDLCDPNVIEDFTFQYYDGIKQENGYSVARGGKIILQTNDPLTPQQVAVMEEAIEQFTYDKQTDFYEDHYVPLECIGTVDNVFALDSGGLQLANAALTETNMHDITLTEEDLAFGENSPEAALA